jgi:rfaE bifunctional protein nucleotidyltransferase chain/domain
MTWQSKIEAKIHSNLDSLLPMVKQWKKEGNSIVFTNGCFDLIHLGHIDYLAKAADLGNKLILGLNSDSSVKELKGEARPIFDETSRSTKLASLAFIDAVVLFSEDTPISLISEIKPDYLVKGGDYSVETVVGSDLVLQNGGQVKLIPFLEGHSSTRVIKKIKEN